MNKNDLIYFENYSNEKWIVAKLISYDEDDFEELKGFDTIEECKKYIEQICI